MLQLFHPSFTILSEETLFLPPPEMVFLHYSSVLLFPFFSNPSVSSVSYGILLRPCGYQNDLPFKYLRGLWLNNNLHHLSDLHHESRPSQPPTDAASKKQGFADTAKVTFDRLFTSILYIF